MQGSFLTNGLMVICTDLQDKNKLATLGKEMKTMFNLKKLPKLDTVKPEESKDGQAYPYLLLPKEVTFQDLRDALAPGQLQLAALGEDVLRVPGSTNTEVKHEFTQEEIAVIDDALCTTIGDIEKLEAEKKQAADEFNTKLKEMETTARTLARQHREGHEWREKECYEVLSFAANKRYFYTVEGDELVKTEDLSPEDRQLCIDMTTLKPADHEETTEEEVHDGKKAAANDNG